MSIVRVPFNLTGGGAAAYVPAGAIWLDGSADYLTRTPGTAGNRKTWTYSTWIKRASLGSNQVFTPGALGSTGGGYYVQFESGDMLTWFAYYTGTSWIGRLTPNALYRDPTAWMNIVIVFDSTQATASDRLSLFVNGTKISSFSVESYPAQNVDGPTNNNQQHWLGCNVSTAQFYNGYLAECVMLDGYRSTDATEFGKYDTNGNWVPVDPSGLTFGTNGFWLDFADSADLGNDVSGNGNDWTPTSMSAANSTSDRPADDADNDVGNYATINPLGNSSGGIGSAILSIGNRRITNENGVTTHPCIEVSSGKWYFEAFIENVGANPPYNRIHVTKHDNSAQYMYRQNGDKETGGLPSSYGNSWTTNDYIGCSVDMDAGKIWFSKNGVWQNSGDPVAGTGEAFSGISGLVYFGCIVVTNSITVLNFGQTAYQYSAPTGFKNLHTANLPAPTVTNPSVYFSTLTYAGDSSSRALDAGFAADFAWLKARSHAFNHVIFDRVRGGGGLFTNSTAVEDLGYGSTWGATGVTVGAWNETNISGVTYVGWFLKAGGAGSSNTDGSITSTVSAAAHGGFSIGTYTGTGASATVGHGLSSTPAMIIVKDRDAANEWSVYHSALGPGKDLQLESSANANNNAALWDNTAPTASVFSVSTIARQNASGNSLVFYAFAKTPGLIGIGSYTGNGSTDGPYVVVEDGGSGFRPAFVLIKNSSTGYDWQIVDATRDTYNPANKNLSPNLITAEGSGLNIDFTANGFKLRVSSNSVNASGNTYIYLAFAEYPFGGDGVAQAKVR